MRSSSPILSLRACRRLHSRKERRETGLFLVEGIRPVLAAFQAGVTIEQVMYSPSLPRGGHGETALDLARSRGIPCVQVSNAEFASMATRENPRGIACVGHQVWAGIEQQAPGESPVVALYAPQDPGNLGTILRTCDATGCRGVVLIGDAVDPWHPAAIRAAMGATFSLHLSRSSTGAFVEWIRARQLPVIGTSDRAPVDYATHDYPERFVLLMGSERQGLPPDLERVTDTMVRIPMAGSVDSLNLAIATALVLYEARNQRTREEVA